MIILMMTTFSLLDHVHDLLLIDRLWTWRSSLSSVVHFPPVPIEGVLAELGHDVGEVHGHVVVHDLPVHHLPEVHVPDLDPLAGGGDTHELPRVNSLLPPKGRCPLSHVQTSLVNTNLV